MTTTYELDRAADRMPPAYAWTMHQPNGLRYHDFFCGAGGSSLGMTGAGMTLALAANHWARAIETHAANFPTAEHVCEDITHYDLRLMPKAEVLWASPICTEASPAGGNAKRSAQEELELFGPVAREGMERTRATFHEVIRAAQLWRYEAVIVENVVDVATKWELFDWWLHGMEVLGYVVQFVSVSSAHVGAENNPHAPQWRDRLYMVFTRKGAPLPDVEPRPRAWCPTCEVDVDAVQSWKKPGRKIGKYRAQYVYVCPRQECRHAVVEPYVLPAAAAIDWSNLGTRVGDRKKPLAAKTRARIAAGLEMFAEPITAEVAGNTYERPGSGYVRAWPAYGAPLTALTTTATKGVAVPPVMVSTNHDDGGRAYPAHAGPLASRTTKIGEGVATAPFVDVARTHNQPRGVDEPLAPVTTGRNHSLVTPPGAFITVHRGGPGEIRVRGVDTPLPAVTASGNNLGVSVPPFIAELRGGHSVARGVDEPAATITASGNHHGLAIPPGAFYVKHFTPRGRAGQMSKDVRTEPFGAITAVDHHSLVIPFRRGARPHPAGAGPVSAVATREQHGLARLGIDVDDCLFRMLTPDEHLRAQRFHADYVVLGNKGERTMQAGNAVSSNVAQWLGAAVAAALCGDARAA